MFIFSAKQLLRKGIAHKVDDSSGSIGKRYTRTDEVAIPFAITIDFDSLQEPHSVTLRERDSTKQLRIPVSEILHFLPLIAVEFFTILFIFDILQVDKAIDVVKELIDGSLTWAQAESVYPTFEQQETTK